MERRFYKTSGWEAFTGNELILKGGLEAGVQLITGYPGSPVADVFEAAASIASYLKSRGVLAQIANNEALAAARLNGARQAGLRAMAVMKSVGYNVAADGLFAGNMARHGRMGGSVIVVGDDPWNDSTQVPQDSRRLSDHLMIPILEPATFQEVKDYVRLAFEVSSLSGLHISVIVSTNLADGGGLVEVAGHIEPRISTLRPQALQSDCIRAQDYVLLPPHTSTLEKEIYEHKLPAALQAAQKLNLNRIEAGAPGGKLGFVAAGLPYTYLREMLLECGLEGRFPILKFGMPFPLDKEILLDFARGLSEIIVIETKRSFLESQIRDFLARAWQHGELREVPAVWGKDFPEGLQGLPAEHGMNPSVLLKRLDPFFRKRGLMTRQGERRLEEVLELERIQLDLPLRTPTFCSGCPHRDSTSVFLELARDLRDPDYMSRAHGRGPVDLIFHGDAGCYSMLYLPPNQRLMQNYSGMGLGGGTAMGMDPFIQNKSVTFLGDGTFFHSGMASVSDAVKSGVDLLYVILDNKTTAMTGHQPHAGVELDLMGEKTFGQNIEKTLLGLVGDSGVPVVRVNPERRQDYRQALEDLILQDGPKFIIADKECGITYHRRKRREQAAVEQEFGYLLEETRIQVNEDACEYCLECTNQTGCPGLTVVQTLHGPKIQTDLSGCVSDGACARIKACPAFEKIIIRRRAPQLTRKLPDESELAEPTPRPVGQVWRAYLAGIGGMGIGAATAVLVRAAKLQGLYVQFCDKKGLAIRGGGVYSHVTFLPAPRVASPVMPYGTADLLLGFDLLEAARGLDPRFNLRVAHPLRTACVTNTAYNPTIRSLIGQDALDTQALEEALKRYTLAEEYWGADVSRVSREWLGHTIYENAMLLGVAFQRSLLPLSLSSLKAAFEENFQGSISEKNLQAFLLGRDLVVHPERYLLQSHQTLAQFLDAKQRALQKRRSAHQAARWREIVDRALVQMRLPEEACLHLAERCYQLVHYQGLSLARSYLRRVLAVVVKDSARHRWQATQAALRSFYKVMAIKDEVWVAHLLTSPDKYERDRKRYGLDLSRGDRVEYVHFNRPRFDVLGIKIEFDLRARDWMLVLMRGLRFLRRLLPRWHAREKEFRDWFLNLASLFAKSREEDYDKWVELLSLPEQVRGYRQVRYPKMEIVRARAAEILSSLPEIQSVKILTQRIENS